MVIFFDVSTCLKNMFISLQVGVVMYLVEAHKVLQEEQTHSQVQEDTSHPATRMELQVPGEQLMEQTLSLVCKISPIFIYFSYLIMFLFQLFNNVYTEFC